VGGALARLAAIKARKSGVKVFYTAHGFHFYKGAPYKNWLLYYPIEKILSRYTDILFTINHEDYYLSKNKFKASECILLPGIGVDTQQFSFSNENRQSVRQELGLDDNDFLVISVGEINKNKNHITIVKAIKALNDTTIKYLIVGQGQESDSLKDYIRNEGLEDRVILLGYRSDVSRLLCGGDVFAFPSIREGLGLAAIEAMSVGLPIVSSRTSGIMEYMVDGVTGFTSDATDYRSFSESILRLRKDDDLRITIGNNNKTVASYYDISKPLSIIQDAYSHISCPQEEH
jgi:glycosyltransferase involved in cell wall biosynthesis